MGLCMANYNESLSFQIPHTPIWASMKVFEDTEKALIRHQYDLETFMKRLFTFLQPGTNKLLSLMVPLS